HWQRRLLLADLFSLVAWQFVQRHISSLAKPSQARSHHDPSKSLSAALPAVGYPRGIPAVPPSLPTSYDLASQPPVAQLGVADSCSLEVFLASAGRQAARRKSCQEPLSRTTE